MYRLKSFLTISILIVSVAFISMSLQKKNAYMSEAVAVVTAAYFADMQRLDSFLVTYPSYFLDSAYETRLKKYHELTRHFKKIEGLFTYFHSKQAYESFLMTAQFQKRDFGPPFPDNWVILGPFGIDPDSVLQKRQASDSAFEKKFIERAARNLRKVIAECEYRKDAEYMSEQKIFDALRLQMARISTIGIANGDYVIEEAGMPGLEAAYESWTDMVLIFAKQLPSTHTELQHSIQQKVQEGYSLLQTKPAFREFNRMQFLTEILIPLSKQLTALQKALKIELEQKPSAMRSTASHVYEPDAFDADYFAPGAEAYLSEAKVELGKFLFFDPILSDNNERACASCHKPELAFTDGFVKSVNFERGDLPRNAPTVINSAFQKQQFWDLRASSLEDQLDSVINSPDELHSSFENVIDRINSSREYKKMFFAAFPETRKQGIQRRHVKIAIACYERVLTGFNTRFDQYVRGDKKQMSADEVNGFNVFLGKAKCGSCHYAPLFNGALPPYFDFTDHRSLGVPLKDTMEVYEVDPDMGFAKLSNNPFTNFSFKVPTLRNIELTAPYMHNGIYKTLEQVIEFYDHAAGDKFIKDMRPGMKGLPFFMILPEPLKLTETEKKNLVLFLRTLTDTTSAKNVPHYLPKLGGKYASIDKRKIGGVY